MKFGFEKYSLCVRLYIQFDIYVAIDGSLIFLRIKLLCVIHCITSMLIGLCERRDGLYYFQNKSRVCALKIGGVDSLDLWYKHMGHPFLQETKFTFVAAFQKKFSIMSKSCDVCPRAKQKREKFPLSSFIVSSICELIHCAL